jgi:hypothetical protein
LAWVYPRVPAVLPIPIPIDIPIPAKGVWVREYIAKLVPISIPITGIP